MTFAEFEQAYQALGNNLKTKDIDAFNRRLIKQGIEVAFLRPYINDRPEYFRTYFQVSMHYRKTMEDKMRFVEENFDLLHDWWHTDIIIPFLGKDPDFALALCKAREYVKSPMPYVRRWGYVLFIPRLVRDPERLAPLFDLFCNDDVHHVVMAESWLISFLAMCDPGRTWQFLKDCDLKYNIVGRAIQKICDSYVVSEEDKTRFKALRPERSLIK